MLTTMLKEKLEHGDYDHVFSREEIDELLVWHDGYDNEASLDEAYSGGYIEGYDAGKADGYCDGENNEWERVRNKYVDILNNEPDDAKANYLFVELDEFFNVELEGEIYVAK